MLALGSRLWALVCARRGIALALCNEAVDGACFCGPMRAPGTPAADEERRVVEEFFRGVEPEARGNTLAGRCDRNAGEDDHDDGADLKVGSYQRSMGPV